VTELVSFDTNAWSELRRGRDALVRTALLELRRAVKERRVQVVVSVPLLMELAGLYDVDHRLYQRCLRELATLGQHRILKTQPEREALELKFRRALQRDEMFASAAKGRERFRSWATHPDVALEKVRLRSAKDDFEKREIYARAVVRETSPRGKRDALVQWWNADPEGLVRDWCQDLAPGSADSVDWARLPSIWHHVSYHVSRVYIVGAEGAGPSRIDPNDLLDGEHYADAAYSSVLVSDDGGLQRIAAVCPEPKVPVRNLKSWAEQLVSG
jgi:hypothetical protein